VAIGNLNLAGSMPLAAFIQDATRGGSLNRLFGSGGVPAIDIGLTYGSGANQANQLFYDYRTLAATTFDNLDLSGSLTDGIGNTSTFTKVKFAAVAVVSPDGSIKVRVGPQNQANAWQGPWGGTGATVYKEVPYWDVIAKEPLVGYTVTNASLDIFSVYNPGASPITYAIIIAGV
jgi:hypothetical protein